MIGFDQDWCFFLPVFEMVGGRYRGTPFAGWCSSTLVSLMRLGLLRVTVFYPKVYNSVRCKAFSLNSFQTTRALSWGTHQSPVGPFLGPFRVYFDDSNRSQFRAC